MRRILAAVVVCLLGTSVWVSVARSQSESKAEWVTNGADMERTGWQKDETKISSSSVKNFQLLWTSKTDNKPMGLAGLLEPVIVSGVSTPEGTRQLAIVAGSSNTLTAIDTETGKIVWHKDFEWLSPDPQSQAFRGFICENADTASPVANAEGSNPRLVYTMTADGFLHTVNAATGEEAKKAIQVSPHAYIKANGLNLYKDTIYTISGQGCGSSAGRNPNTVYAVDLETGQTTQMQPGQSGMWGVAGVAIAPDGMMYAETGDGAYDVATKRLSTSVLQVDPATTQIKNYYTPDNHEWLTERDMDMNYTPSIFPYKGRELLIASGKEGRYYLLDTKTMGGPNHETPLYKTPLVSNTNVNFQTEGSWGSGATWEDSKGTRWYLAPIGGPLNPQVKFPVNDGPIPDGATIAFRVEDVNGKPEMVPAWVSRDMVTAETPVIANEVVFALAAGEFTGQGHDGGTGLWTAEERVARSVPAILYALDGQTGKVLWSSGHEIGSFLHEGGMAVADGRVIFGTNDGTVYCFGLR
ncbi:MAG TPA: PQQ-binding-like beta-propeller repeat protein [Candidatus Acidoferrales bacterium]|nr:PQQ-binding-like beta-propeller repeat protein [Candidatus Acidoferrales bacterium]